MARRSSGVGVLVCLAALLPACGTADPGANDLAVGQGGDASGNASSAASGGDPAGSGGSGGSGGGAGGSGGSAVPDGSWDNPFVIDALPFVTQGSTVDGVSEVDSYAPCAPATSEAGPEVVYQLTVTSPGFLMIEVDDQLGDSVDVDVHLLAAADGDSCVTRGNVLAGAPVLAGTHYIVVDSWTDASYAGDYTLSVTKADDGSICSESPIVCDGMLPPFVNIFGSEAPGDPGCLPGMARVTDFCIDRYEASVVEMTAAGWTPHSPYAHPADDAVLAALSIEGAIPQAHISQVQAADACLMAGKRLCNDSEWQRACEGSAGSTYPYGDALEPGVCNDARSCHPVIQYFESDESWVWSELGHPCIGQLPEGLAATGAHPGCETEEGVLDMMGNLHEWTADPAGTFRGGFFVDTSINGPGCSYATTAHDVLHHDYSTGFRCCADAN